MVLLQPSVLALTLVLLAPRCPAFAVLSLRLPGLRNLRLALRPQLVYGQVLFVAIVVLDPVEALPRVYARVDARHYASIRQPIKMPSNADPDMPECATFRHQLVLGLLRTAGRVSLFRLLVI